MVGPYREHVDPTPAWHVEVTSSLEVARRGLARRRWERGGLRLLAGAAYVAAACFAGSPGDGAAGRASIGVWTPLAAAATLAVVRAARVCGRIEDLEAEVVRLEQLLATDEVPTGD